MSPILGAFALFAFFSTRASAEAGGRVGADFLRIVMSPRAVGMGEAGVASYDDVLGSMSLNPAGLGPHSRPETAFTYNRWFEDISLQQMAYAHPSLRWGTAALSVQRFSVSPIAGYDDSGAPAGGVEAGGTAVGGAYARRLGASTGDRRLGTFLGAGGMFVRQVLAGAVGSAFLFDAGVLQILTLGPGHFSAGASARSLGPGLRYDAVTDPSPTVYRFGMGYSLPVFQNALTAVYDIRKPSDLSLAHGIGVEYLMERLVAWRVGWTSGQDLGNGVRFGVGLRVAAARFDYGMARLGDFGFTHRISAGFRFGEPIERRPAVSHREAAADFHVERAEQLYRRGRLGEAASELSEALRLDPQSKSAERLLRRVRDKMGEGP